MVEKRNKNSKILDKILLKNRRKKVKIFEENLRVLERIEKKIANIERGLDRKFPEIAARMVNSTPEKLKELEKKFVGQRCFLLGTAPSLMKIDFDALGNEKVFTVNGGINLLGDQLKNIFGYVVADPTFYRENHDNINISKVDHIFINSTAFITNPAHLETAYIFDSYRRPKMHEGQFQFDLTQPVFSSHTVMHAAIQIAVYMGFTSIYIAGVDLSFGGKDPHFYESSEREIYDSNSRSLTNAEKMYLGFESANKILSARGIKLYNLSESGALDCVERVDVSTVFGKAR